MADRFSGIEDLDNEEAFSNTKRRGLKRTINFPRAPLGTINHPYIDWVIDKATMELYMHNYSKQEGCAVNPKKDRETIRWRCIHYGKYNNHRRLPAEVTDKNRRQEAIERGTCPEMIVIDMLGQQIRLRRGASSKQGCPFYVAFTKFESYYRCSGIHAVHTCETDSNNWDRFARYRNQDPTVRELAIDLMENGIKSGQAASLLNSKYETRIQYKDVHRIIQTHKNNSRSLSDVGLGQSEVQRLIEAIEQAGDRYRIKFKEGTDVMDCFFYWDESDVKIAQAFCQVYTMHYAFIDFRSSK